MNTINTDTLIQFLLEQQVEEKTIDLNLSYEIFFNNLKINNRDGTTKGYKATLKPIYKFLRINNIYTSNKITNEIIEKYIISRKPFVKPITINKEIKSLKTMMNLMVKKKLINKVPFEFSCLKTTKPKIESIQENDIKKIITYFKTGIIDIKHQLLFLLILTTGIRTSEVINIKNENIDLKRNAILLDFTKNGKSRYIYIIDYLIPMINKIKSKKIYLFNEDDGTKFTDNALRCFFKRLKKRLNIEILSPHKLRHFYATNLYKKTLDIQLVSKLLGHSDIKMTEIYLDIDYKNLQEKNNYYNPLNDFIY